jgi:hypothetical protein
LPREANDDVVLLLVPRARKEFHSLDHSLRRLEAVSEFCHSALVLQTSDDLSDLRSTDRRSTMRERSEFAQVEEVF